MAEHNSGERSRPTPQRRTGSEQVVAFGMTYSYLHDSKSSANEIPNPKSQIRTFGFGISDFEWIQVLSFAAVGRAGNKVGRAGNFPGGSSFRHFWTAASLASLGSSGL